MEETKIENLKKNLKFPVTAYVKENGYLGMVSVVNDEFFITTKSNPEGEYAKNFKRLFFKIVKYPEKIKEYIKEKNCSLVFEVIDTLNDPHIIEYKEDKIILLDIIKNDITFNAVEYGELIEIVKNLSLNVKREERVLKDFEELESFIKEVTDSKYTYYDKNIEGFVLSDQNNFHFKLKLWYYNKWKKLRTICQGILADRSISIDKVKMIPYYDEEFNDFINWVSSNKETFSKTDIISLRNEYFKNKK